MALGSHSTLTPKGTRTSSAQSTDDVGHRGGGGHVHLQLVGPVVLVAEHDRVEAGRLERPKVGARVGDDALHARASSCSGVPGVAPTWTMAMMGLTAPNRSAVTRHGLLPSGCHACRWARLSYGPQPAVAQVRDDGRQRAGSGNEDCVPGAQDRLGGDGAPQPHGVRPRAGPEASPKAKAPTNASPAPVVSTASTAARGVVDVTVPRRPAPPRARRGSRAAACPRPSATRASALGSDTSCRQAHGSRDDGELRLVGDRSSR